MDETSASVLVVDDDTNARSIICSALDAHGYSRAAAGNGREALIYLKNCAAQPRLILLDLMMPVMTGWEFRRAQEADPSLRAIPVAIITGLPETGPPGTGGAQRALGAVDTLTKPSRIEPLMALVSRFCPR